MNCAIKCACISIFEKRKHNTNMEETKMPKQRYANSPFTEGYEPPTKTAYTYKKMPTKILVDKASGLETVAEFRFPYQKDAGRYVKVHHDALRDLGQLGNTARRCLDFLMSQVLPDNAVVWAPASEAVAWCRFNTPKSWYDGLASLIEHGYVARTPKQSFYHTNPRVFHNGSRLSLKHEYSKPTHKNN